MQPSSHPPSNSKNHKNRNETKRTLVSGIVPSVMKYRKQEKPTLICIALLVEGIVGFRNRDGIHHR
jgi:hypothetical protein